MTTVQDELEELITLFREQPNIEPWLDRCKNENQKFYSLKIFELSKTYLYYLLTVCADCDGRRQLSNVFNSKELDLLEKITDWLIELQKIIKYAYPHIKASALKTEQHIKKFIASNDIEDIKIAKEYHAVKHLVLVRRKLIINTSSYEKTIDSIVSDFFEGVFTNYLKPVYNTNISLHRKLREMDYKIRDGNTSNRFQDNYASKLKIIKNPLDEYQYLLNFCLESCKDMSEKDKRMKSKLEDYSKYADALDTCLKALMHPRYVSNEVYMYGVKG